MPFSRCWQVIAQSSSPFVCTLSCAAYHRHLLSSSHQIAQRRQCHKRIRAPLGMAYFCWTSLHKWPWRSLLPAAQILPVSCNQLAGSLSGSHAAAHTPVHSEPIITSPTQFCTPMPSADDNGVALRSLSAAILPPLVAILFPLIGR